MLKKRIVLFSLLLMGLIGGTGFSDRTFWGWTPVGHSLAATRSLSSQQPFSETDNRFRSTHQGAIFPGEINTVVVSAATSDSSVMLVSEETQIQVFHPDNRLAATIQPSGPSNNLQVIDVVDLDGDGAAEVIAINAAQGKTACSTATVYAFKAVSRDFGFGFDEILKKTFIGEEAISGLERNNIATYQVSGSGTLRHQIVVAPDASAGNVYFFRADINGASVQSVRHSLAENAGISVPTIAVRDTLPNPGQEVLIMSEGRVAVFQEDGEPVQKSAEGAALVTQFGSDLKTGGVKAACTYSFSYTTKSVSASGGDFTVNIQTGLTCNWTVTANATPTTLSFPNGNSGTGSINGFAYRVGPNLTTSSRVIILTLTGGATLTITQSGIGGGDLCQGTFSQSKIFLSSSGPSTQSVGINIGSTCTWSVTKDVSWITFPPGGNQGTGPATLTFNVTANTTGRSRTGRLTLNNGAILTVTQF